MAAVAAVPVETDAVVVGAGPVGLFQVFQLGLQEIGAHVVDSLPHPGGQCVELYGDKPIYDIPGIAVCTGQELATRLLAQIEPFAATFHYGQVVSSLQKQADGRFLLGTSRGTQLLARTVFIAAGVGAFQPRTLKVDGLERFARTQVFYTGDALPDLAARNVVVLGDDDEALRAAMRLAQAASVTLVHRRDAFRAEPATVLEMRAQVDAGRMRFAAGQPVGIEEAGDRLAALRIALPDGGTSSLPADAVVALLGLSPKLGPVAQWGLELERKQLKVDTEQFSTSEPGIFAVGDVNTYPGKKKLILCGFHEATLAAFGAAAIVHPGREIHLQYTTTSPRLHKLLGVATPPID